jgi:prevent-host-death family protein
MKTINAAKFKAECLSILEKVDPEGIVITKHGVAVAKLVPIDAEPRALIGALKDKIKLPESKEEDDLFSTGIHWRAHSR